MFKIDGSKTQFTEAELIEELRRFAVAVGGQVFMVEQFRKWKERRCTPETICRRLGSWPRALSLIGMASMRVREYGAEELIENLERVWRKLGRAPGVVAMARHGGMTAAPYCRIWGSLAKACKAFVRWKNGTITRETLLRGRRGRRRGHIRASVRWAVLEQDGGRCRVCGRGAGKGLRLEVDHIVPVSAGGGDEKENLRALCFDCNRGRGGGRGVVSRQIAACARGS